VEMFGIDGWMNGMNDGLLVFRSNDFFHNEQIFDFLN